MCHKKENKKKVKKNKSKPRCYSGNNEFRKLIDPVYNISQILPMTAQEAQISSHRRHLIQPAYNINKTSTLTQSELNVVNRHGIIPNCRKELY
jgi:hypothetical protein